MSVVAPILTALVIIFATLSCFAGGIELPIIAGIIACALLIMIIVGAVFSTNMGCRYFWCACTIKQNDVCAAIPKSTCENETRIAVVQSLQEGKEKQYLNARLQRVKNYDCCTATSVLRIASFVATFAFMTVCIIVDDDSKWIYLGFACAAGTYLLISSIVALALGKKFGSMQYLCFTCCTPKDSTFDLDVQKFVTLQPAQPDVTIQTQLALQMPYTESPPMFAVPSLSGPTYPILHDDQ